MTDNVRWTRAEIRSAAIVAKEQNVAIKLNVDGSLQVSPFNPTGLLPEVEPVKKKVIRM